ncbi:SDR family oxidoreductase [Chelatococcus reniformis]|uniref:3-oxoacyl-ACP reductase n=1 Tax=Chelatococcus reniformis TaxID=1494448 RepID=A0A916UY10_9HYPH|nr:SDR family oxidoreductase [Chelatococcus reniformis]GGC93909.1 3-oxoacyl-ACP reductase [Chelatococcus reniformis]
MSDATRTYIITGAAGAIGGAAVERLLSKGANILATDISQRRLDILTERMAGGSGRLATFRANLKDEGEVNAAVACCLETFSSLHGVANVVGGIVGMDAESVDRPLNRTGLDYFRRTFELNVDTVFLMCRAVEPHFTAQSYGKIVNVASLAAFANRNEQGDFPYSAAKAAVIALTHRLSLLLGPAGIRLNCVAPGLVMSDLPQEVFDAGYVERHIADTALKNLATAHDQAEAIAFFLEPQSDAITGEVLRVAAGMR